MKANELKVTDLMVGDWVYIISGLLKTELTQIIPYHFVGASLSFEAITLTPEILKKNGFLNSYIDESLNKDSVYKYNHFYKF